MIYFLEDDNNIRNFVIYALENTGFKAAGFDHPEKFWEAMEDKLPELIILDIMLPGEDSLSIVKHAVNRLGGSISVESTEGVGTKMTVRIPINN